ncbi:TetR/AcrR family transcriptional regulator [Agitococcus lubricus]|uniref:TetR family transcriptional regulator n=1 Tax=Agitococcus lubricus TaxID=1077255 RepID=A0A2T5IUW5_9GAMM|nr:TetR/AcrR family transcriptional regulator [Agitococcus lubricus]PTQ87684.1 TetR family transcriptional regulator [Agitococcus lubricus]
MRYPPEHKAAARAKLLAASAAVAKKEGFSHTGMDALTAAAGMTTGAFYSQFSSKQELLSAIVEQELTKTLALFSQKTPEQLLVALGRYLSLSHVEHPEAGCAIPSLGAEIARADLATKQCFEQHLCQLVYVITQTIGDEKRAWAIICQAIGGVVVARAMASSELQQTVLQAVQESGRQVLQLEPLSDV